MNNRDWAVVVLNALLLVGLCALLGVGRVSWDQFLIGLGLLGAPSAASLLRRGRAPEADVEKPSDVHRSDGVN